MNPRIPGWRAGWLLVRVRWRRLLNQRSALVRRRGRGGGGGSPDLAEALRPRVGTGAKSTGGVHWVLLVAVLFLFTALNFSREVLTTIEKRFGPFLGDAAWFTPSADYLMFEIGVLLVAMLVSTLGSKELSSPEWDLEWLATLPLPLRALLAIRLGERALVSAYALMMLFPFLVVAGWRLSPHGSASASVAAAVLVGVLLMVFVAAAQTAVEIAARLRLSPSRLRNLQATFSVAGMLALVAAMVPGMGRGRVVIEWGAHLPDWLRWTPPGLAVAALTGRPLVDGGGDGGWAALALLAVETAVVAALAVAWLARALRPGVIAGGVRESGGRIARAAAAAVATPVATTPVATGRPPLLTAVQRRELRLLGRDRNFLVQTLVTPLVVVGMQVVFSARSDGGLDHVLGAEPTTLAAIAFGIAAYALMFSALQTLNAEGVALWLLYTVPRPLERILREKAVLWASVATLYPLAIFLAASIWRGSISLEMAGLAVIVIAGVPVYAVVGTALGVFACNPLAHEVTRKVKPGYLYLYMLLASLYTYAIYATTYWARAGLMILSVLLALALWQKARDRLPYLLDPDASPRAAVSLSDGLIAALLFFVLQGLVMHIQLRGGRKPTGVHLFTAFTIAGAVAFVAMQVAFARRRAAGVPRIFGARPLRAVLLGLAAGLVASAAGIGYLVVLQRSGHLAPFLERDRGVLDAAAAGPWLLVLAVLAAPVFEEFIFRGLVFGGLRRSVRGALAVLASAAIFAIVHPAVGVPPVFVMGLAAALVYDRTGLLIAPMVTHAVYNAMVIAVAPRLL